MEQHIGAVRTRGVRGHCAGVSPAGAIQEYVRSHLQHDTRPPHIAPARIPLHSAGEVTDALPLRVRSLHSAGDLTHSTAATLGTHAPILIHKIKGCLLK